MTQIRIALADDHPLFCEGIKRLLDSEPSFQVSIVAHSATELLAKMTRHKIDVVLADVSMPLMNGVALTKIICRDFISPRVIGLSLHNQHWYIREMLVAGAKGYVVKSAGPPELIAAIREVYSGKSFFCREATMALAGNYMLQGMGHVPPDFTGREIQLIRMLIDEQSDADIADKLKISLKTVANERRSIMEKAGVKTLVGLGRWVVEQCLV